MEHHIKKSKHLKKSFESDIIDEIFSEIEKDVEEDLSYYENRKDKFYIAMRNIFIKEKVYRNPLITRDNLIERLNTNKELFIHAFQYCFGMSFRECINRLRLKEAVILLEQSDLPIEGIAGKWVLEPSVPFNGNLWLYTICRLKTIEKNISNKLILIFNL